jgi:hypothetical protein
MFYIRIRKGIMYSYVLLDLSKVKNLDNKTTLRVQQKISLSGVYRTRIPTAVETCFLGKN